MCLKIILNYRKMIFINVWILCTTYYIIFVSSNVNGSTIEVGEWDYDHHHTKPENWKGICKHGKRQSPININTHQTVKAKIHKPFSFHGYERKINGVLRNNGHTIVLELNSRIENIFLEGGGLNGSKFMFKQAHFHWGFTNNQGSEHTINKKYSIMELHLVNWNKDVADTYEEAIKSTDYNSLAVLAINFRIGKRNDKLETLIKAVEKVRDQGSNARIENGVRLENMLPDNTSKFYRYNGSLTTPGCNEIVVWTVFKKQVVISQDQMDAFRTTTYVHKGESDARVLSNNYRPTQELNGRIVADVKVSRIDPRKNEKKGSFQSSDERSPDENTSGIKSVSIDHIHFVCAMIVSFSLIR